MKTKDILATNIVDNKIDVSLKNGDFLIGVSDRQLISMNLKYQLGHLKQDINVGAGVDALMNGSFTSYDKSRVIKQLLYDNISVKTVNYNNSKLEIIL